MKAEQPMFRTITRCSRCRFVAVLAVVRPPFDWRMESVTDDGDGFCLHVNDGEHAHLLDVKLDTTPKSGLATSFTSSGEDER